MSDRKMPMCWKCVSKVIDPNPGGQGGFSLNGCKENAAIHSFRDAESMCPLLQNPHRVVVIISGGAATIEHKPDNVVVEIRDYDVEGDWDEDNIGCKVDSEGSRYQEMIFPAEDIDLGSEQVIVEPDEPPMFRNYYRCPDCNEEWQDEWSCKCDDECPTCSIPYSPYKSEDIINSIGWQPHEDNFPIAGLETFEVYEDLETGKGYHPEVQRWIEIFEGMIEEPTIIPSDKNIPEK
jgi:hypothetical protein